MYMPQVYGHFPVYASKIKITKDESFKKLWYLHTADVRISRRNIKTAFQIQAEVPQNEEKR